MWDPDSTRTKAVKLNKKKRNIEPEASFGQFTSDIVIETGMRPTEQNEQPQKI